MNFLVVLPILNPAFINPAFIDLMPPVVTLASKFLFGAALAWTLGRHSVASA